MDTVKHLQREDSVVCATICLSAGQTCMSYAAEVDSSPFCIEQMKKIHAGKKPPWKGLHTEKLHFQAVIKSAASAASRKTKIQESRGT